MQKNNLDSYLTLDTRMNAEWVKDSGVRPETMKLPVDTRRTRAPELSDSISDVTSNVHATEAKPVGLHRTHSFSTVEGAMRGKEVTCGLDTFSQAYI